MISLRKLARFFVYVALVLSVIASVLSVLGIGAYVFGAGVALGFWLASVVCWVNDPESKDYLRLMGLR